MPMAGCHKSRGKYIVTGEANVNPTESVAYRKSLLEKGRKEMTREEKEWLECNPVYVIKNDKLYYKRDIL